MNKQAWLDDALERLDSMDIDAFESLLVECGHKPVRKESISLSLPAHKVDGKVIKVGQNSSFTGNNSSESPCHTYDLAA